MNTSPQFEDRGVEQPAPAHVPTKSSGGTQPPAYAAGQPQGPYEMQQPMSAAAPAVTPLQRLQDVEAWIDCPFCHQRTRTRVVKVSSTTTYLLGVLLFFTSVVLACVPCLAHCAADIDHWCTNCNKQVTHQPNGGTVQVLDERGPDTVPSRYAAGPDMEASGGMNVGKPATTH